MKKALLASLILSLVMAVSVSYADVPPPPVNQDLGLPDGAFGNLVEAQCRACHENRDSGFSMFSTFDPTRVPDRHHITVQRDGNECLDCHDIVVNPDNTTELGIFRDCQYCHLDGRPGLLGDPNDPTHASWILPPGTPHHRTTFAKAKQCYRCHGSTVNNAETITHNIPTYEKSMVTPNTCRDTAGGEGLVQCDALQIANHAYNSCPVRDPITNQCIGGCQACHKAGTVSGYIIGENNDNHHGTTLGTVDGNECQFCHGNVSLGEDIVDIRKCEECHGISTLHNIMVNYSANVGTHGYGHVGVSQDCFGCHGWYAKYDYAPEAGPIVPDVDTVSPTELAVGEAAVVTIDGMNFVNSYEVVPGMVLDYTSKVVVDDLNGNAVTIEPDSITGSSITATLPALAAGKYYLYLTKADKVSGMYALTVSDAVVLTSAVESGTDIVISGSNFGPAPATEYTSDMGVYVTNNGATEKGDIISWTDTEIVASASVSCGEVRVVTVMGSVYGVADCSGPGNGNGKGNGKGKNK